MLQGIRQSENASRPEFVRPLQQSSVSSPPSTPVAPALPEACCETELHCETSLECSDVASSAEACEPFSFVCSDGCDIQAVAERKQFLVNGIMMDDASIDEAQAELEQNFRDELGLDLDVEVVRNESNGLLRDGLETFRNLIGNDTDISREARSRFREALDRGESIQINAYSQGLAVSGDALFKLREEYRAEGKTESEIQEILSRVHVQGYGGFGSEDSFPEGLGSIQLEKDADDSVHQVGEAYVEVGRSVQELKANLRSGNSWRRFGAGLGNALKESAEAVLTNARDAVVSGARNLSDLRGENGQVTRQSIDDFCASVGAEVCKPHSFDNYMAKNTQETHTHAQV